LPNAASISQQLCRRNYFDSPAAPCSKPIFLVEAFVDSSKVETTSLMTGGSSLGEKERLGLTKPFDIRFQNAYASYQDQLCASTISGAQDQHLWAGELGNSPCAVGSTGLARAISYCE